MHTHIHAHYTPNHTHIHTLYLLLTAEIPQETPEYALVLQVKQGIQHRQAVPLSAV